MRGATFVWEALGEARRANLADAGEAMPQSGYEGISRRSLLAALAATGVAAACHAPRRPASAMARSSSSAAVSPG